MSATVAKFPIGLTAAQVALDASALNVEAAIREADTIPAAYAYFQQLRALEQVLMRLTTLAMQRCEELEAVELRES